MKPIRCVFQLFCTALIWAVVFSPAFSPVAAQTISALPLPSNTGVPIKIVPTSMVNGENGSAVLVLHSKTQISGQSVAWYKTIPGQPLEKTWDFKLPETLKGDIVDVQVADMDGDEHPEILCLANTINAANSSEHSPWLFAFEWNGNTFAETPTSRWSYQATPGVNLRPSQFRIADFDNDGNPEAVIIFGSPERIGLMVQREGSLETGLWTPEYRFNIPDDTQGGLQQHLFSADLTADAISEFLLMSSGNALNLLMYTYVNANQYAPATTLQFPVAIKSGQSDLPIGFTDLDRDGYSEIVTGSPSGAVSVLARTNPENEIFQFVPHSIRNFNTGVRQIVSLPQLPGFLVTLADPGSVYVASFAEGNTEFTPHSFTWSRLNHPELSRYQISCAAPYNQGIWFGAGAAEVPPALLTAVWPQPQITGTREPEKTEMAAGSKKPDSATKQSATTPDQIAYIGKKFHYPVDFDILSLDDLKIEFNQAPKGMRYNHRASRLEWTPNLSQKGFHKVEINVRSSNYQHNEQFTVLAKVDPPVIVSDPKTVVTAGEPWDYQVQIADQEMYDSLQFSLLAAPDNMTINSKGWLYWTPSLNQVDDQAITIAVSDGYDIDTQSFSVYVNAPPSFLSQPETFTAVGQEYTYNILIGDRNKDAKLQLSLKQHPTGMALNGRQITWTPDANQVDYYPVTLTLSDGFLQTTQEWSVFVNSPPRITSQPLDFLSYNQQYRYQVEVEDLNANQPISYQLLQNPDGMSISENGLLTWKPGDTINRQSFVIRASDGYATDDQRGEVFINVPPEFVSEPEVVAVSELAYTYKLQGQDANGDPLRFSAIQLPKYAEFNSTEQTVTWKPSIEQTGKQLFKLQVTDSHGATSIQEFQVQVYENPSTKPLIFSGYYILIAVLGGIFVVTAAL